MESESLPGLVVEYKPLEEYRSGRRFRAARKVRMGDVDPDGRLRLDALARYCQDVSNDDTTDACLDDEPGWVVRFTVIDELRPATLAERLAFHTFCSGLGKRWAERRLTVEGSAGACYQVSTLWVCVDHTTGQPARLTDQFLDLYSEAADGRSASARLRIPRPSVVPAQQRHQERWQLRRTDFDPLGHVNNAAYWAVVEQWLEPFDQPRRVRVEYGGGVAAAPNVLIERAAEPGHLMLWWWDGDEETVTASAMVQPASDSDGEAAAANSGANSAER